MCYRYVLAVHYRGLDRTKISLIDLTNHKTIQNFKPEDHRKAYAKCVELNGGLQA